MAMKGAVSRRKFMKGSAAGAVLAAAASAVGDEQAIAAETPSRFDRAMVIAKLGDTLIPSTPGDPGYASLEPYNITAEVMKGLASVPDDQLNLFNESSARGFEGKTFLELSEAQRAEYLNLIVDGADVVDTAALEKLQGLYRLARARVFVVFYQNYPQHLVPRDSKGFTILPANDQHQITNPNQPGLVTGWDIAGWVGPMTWEEEEQRRAHFKTVRWQEE